MSYAEVCFSGLHLESFGRYGQSAKTPVCAQNSPPPAPTRCILLLLVVLFFPILALIFRFIPSTLPFFLTSFPLSSVLSPPPSLSSRSFLSRPLAVRKGSLSLFPPPPQVFLPYCLRRNGRGPKQFNIAQKMPRERYVPSPQQLYIFLRLDSPSQQNVSRHHSGYKNASLPTERKKTLCD